jgi:hypothetical protein
MLTLVPFIQLLVNVVLATLQASGVTSPSITALATSLESSVVPLFDKLASGSDKTADTLAVLGALSGVLTTLRNQPGLDAKLLDQINVLDMAVSAGLAGYVQAGKGIDLSLLTPIPQAE